MNPELLHTYLDGELTPEEAARIENELAADPRLARELEALRAVDEALESLPAREAPPDLAERVLERARKLRRGRILRIALPLAAAAAAVLIAVLPFGGDPGPPAEIFTAQDYLDYTWEADSETFGSLALTDVEDLILEELEAT